MSKLEKILRIGFCFVVLVAFSFLGTQTASGQESNPPRSPAENPPAMTLDPAQILSLPAPIYPSLGAPTVEWTLHKTADGAHPDGREQQVMWLMNRARANPSAEGVWLATSTDPDIADGRNWFVVNTTVLQNEFNGYSAKPPAAFDVRLYNAAKAHSDDLIARDAQDHTGQFDRINTAGFKWQAVRGNVFAYADSSLNAHAAWNIDWGSGTADGMQTGRGHRQAIMSLDPNNYTNVGVALVYENNPGTSVGPYVTTGNYCKAITSYADHYNQFIVGTVWRDLNGNSQYDPGEGIGGVTVTPNAGTYYAVTSASGGYAIPVTMAPGTYSVTFTGSASGTKNLTIGSTSALLDLVLGAPILEKKLYLPMIMNTWSPLPAICTLYIENETGGQMYYEVYGTGLGPKYLGGGSTFYGSFPAGTYSYHPATICGTVDETLYFPGGAKTHVFSCTGFSSGARPGNNPTTPAAHVR